MTYYYPSGSGVLASFAMFDGGPAVPVPVARLSCGRPAPFWPPLAPDGGFFARKARVLARRSSARMQATPRSAAHKKTTLTRPSFLAGSCSGRSLKPLNKSTVSARIPPPPRRSLWRSRGPPAAARPQSLRAPRASGRNACAPENAPAKAHYWPAPLAVPVRF